MKVRCNDCNREFDLPRDFFVGGAYRLFSDHGFPPSFTLIAKNGQTRESGPPKDTHRLSFSELSNKAMSDALADYAWADQQEPGYFAGPGYTNPN